MIITLIAAMDENGGIGRATGGVPWHLPDETTHFRAYCTHKWLLAGRRTFEEMTEWFQPDHHVIVLTRRPLPSTHPSHLPTSHLTSATTIDHALNVARSAHAQELVVIGGATTYALALPDAHQLVLSRLHLQSHATIRFPQFSTHQWECTSTTHHQDRSSATRFDIELWHRRHPPNS